MEAPVTWPAPDATTMNADPRFVSAEDQNLTEFSPCRAAGAGTHLALGASDTDGDERVVGATIDGGADEYEESSL